MSPLVSTSRRRLYRPAADVAGAIASGACALHCAAMPFAAMVLPAAAARVFAGEGVHALLAGLVVATSLAAFVPGWLRHGDLRVWKWALAGLGLILFARLAGTADLGVAGEALVTTAGGGLLLVAHRLNHSLAYWSDKL
ncbi:MAG: MerC domain-containing protein [Limisphaerales bacterium]